MDILSTKFNFINILIVDDESAVREYLRMEIEDNYKNVNIIEASDGNEALVKAQNQRFEIVITDLKMPNLSGSSLVKHLGRLTKKMKPKRIIVFSGYLDDSISELSTQSENISFLSKPIDIELFFKYLDEILLKNHKNHKSHSKMNVQFINPFVDSVIEVLGMSCNIIPQHDSNSIRRGEDHSSSDISSVVYMNSEFFLGSFAIAFPEKTYMGIYEKMLGEEIFEINDENCDGVAELCSQIFSQAKKKLNGKGFDIQMAIPTVIYGHGHRIKHFISGPCLNLNFKSDLGPFFIEITVKSVP